MEYIYINTSIATQLEYEQKLKEVSIIMITCTHVVICLYSCKHMYYMFISLQVLNVLKNFPDCLHPLISFLCHSTFPLCDMSYPTPRPRKVSISLHTPVYLTIFLCLGMYNLVYSSIRSVYPSIF